ncbi:MAG: UDP-N-acetylmuramoyl-tripeptide--D-alanyl-D-alanine ligase [Verrucomicrobiota bacterium]
MRSTCPPSAITNIGTAHIEHMGSREAIAREKGEVAAALPDDGFLVVNGEDDFADELKKRTKAKAVGVGGETGIVRATGLAVEATGSRFNLNFKSQSMPIQLPVPGSHMVTNALLAAAVGLYLGVTAENVAAGLGSLDLTPGRVQQKKVGGIRFLDDSYNANPDSMEASLATLSEMEVAGKRFALLGVMAELGQHAVEAHRNLGKLALEKGVDHLCSVGEGAREITSGLMPTQGQAVHHFSTQDEAAAFIQATAGEGDLVLLKGSRVAAMEKVIELYATRIKK